MSYIKLLTNWVFRNIIKPLCPSSLWLSYNEGIWITSTQIPNKWSLVIQMIGPFEIQTFYSIFTSSEWLCYYELGGCRNNLSTKYNWSDDIWIANYSLNKFGTLSSGGSNTEHSDSKLIQLPNVLKVRFRTVPCLNGRDLNGQDHSHNHSKSKHFCSFFDKMIQNQKVFCIWALTLPIM